MFDVIVHGCTKAQGFYYSKAIAADIFYTFVCEQNAKTYPNS